MSDYISESLQQFLGKVKNIKIFFVNLALQTGSGAFYYPGLLRGVCGPDNPLTSTHEEKDQRQQREKKNRQMFKVTYLYNIKVHREDFDGSWKLIHEH